MTGSSSPGEDPKFDPKQWDSPAPGSHIAAAARDAKARARKKPPVSGFKGGGKFAALTDEEIDAKLGDAEIEADYE